MGGQSSYSPKRARNMEPRDNEDMEIYEERKHWSEFPDDNEILREE
jgi:hypothetical protein